MNTRNGKGIFFLVLISMRKQIEDKRTKKKGKRKGGTFRGKRKRADTFVDEENSKN